MIDCAFISRHSPTSEQIEMARSRGFHLIPIGDHDAFDASLPEKCWIWEEATPEFPEGRSVMCDAVCVVHPAAALSLSRAGRTVLIFENGNRAPEGEKPQFFPKKLHVYPAW